MGASDASALANAKSVRSIAAHMRAAAEGSSTAAKAIRADADVLLERAALLERAGESSEVAAQPSATSSSGMSERQKALAAAVEAGAGLGALHLSKDTWAALKENADKGQATWLELFDACDDVARD